MVQTERQDYCAKGCEVTCAALPAPVKAYMRRDQRVCAGGVLRLHD